MVGQQDALAQFLNATTASQNLGTSAISVLISYLDAGRAANVGANNAASSNASVVNEQNANVAAGIGSFISSGANAFGRALQGLFKTNRIVGPLPGSPLVQET